MHRWRHLMLSALAIAIAAGALSFLSTSKQKVNSKSGSVLSASLSTENSPQDETQESARSLPEQLNLTLNQRQQINRIRRQYQQQMGERQENLKSLQQELSQMMAGEEPASLVRRKNQELMALRREIEQLRFESMLAAREILTLPQRQKFMEIVRERRQKL